MKQNDLLNELKSLNLAECIGKQYYQQYGNNLRYSQYFFLQKRGFPKHSIELLNNPQTISEINNFEVEFRKTYPQNELSETGFFSPDCNIELEQLLRFIHIPAHQHDFLEISCVLSGNCTHIIDGKSFSQSVGCITYIPSHVKHELHASEDCVCITIKIRSQTFQSFQPPNLPYFSVPVCFYCANDTAIQSLVLSMYQQQKNRLAYSTSIIEHLFQVLTIYCMQKYQDTMTLLVVDNPYAKLNLDIINYMFENYQTVTLHSLAKHLHYSDAYLSNLIHQETGETFSSLLRNFRLKKAATLLKETDMKLNDICDAVGYKDTSQFIRNFKEMYHITPAKFRKQFHNIQ